MPATHARHRRNTVRVATYNILIGGARRHQLIRDVLTRIDADIIALQEVCDLDFLEGLATTLGMQSFPGEPSEAGTSCHIAVLSRLPVNRSHNRRHHGSMLRSHLYCEIATGGRAVPIVGVHCVHLAARFGERAKGEARRMRELTAVLEGVRHEAPLPHMLIGDFNALSPGDGVAATRFFRRMHQLRNAGLMVARDTGYIGPVPRDGTDDARLDAAWQAAGIDPRLDNGVPLLPRQVWSLTSRLPVNDSVDRFLGRFIERWSIERLLALGYVDCFRRIHPRAQGRTCATWLPAARVDYVFADPLLAAHVAACDVVGGTRWPDRDAAVASDHFPVVADFAV